MFIMMLGVILGRGGTLRDSDLVRRGWPGLLRLEAGA